MACNKLHVTNLPPGDMNAFALSLYLSTVLGDEVHIAGGEDAVQFNATEDEAIVQLSQPISETTVRGVNRKNKRPFGKRVPIFECAPHCVRMSGLSPNTSKDALQLFCEQKVFGGGANPVAFMELNNCVATVGFVAEEVCSRVVAVPVRKIDGVDVKLERCAFAFCQPDSSASKSGLEVVKEASVTRTLEVDQTKYKIIKHRVKNEIDHQVKRKEKKDPTKGMVTVELSGLESEVNAALVLVYGLIHSVKEISVSLGKEAMALVCKNLGKKLQQLLDQQGIAARISAKPGAGITAFTLADPAAVTSAIKDSFSTASIPTKGTSLSSIDWPAKKFQLEMSEDVVVKESTGYLQVYGYKHAVNDAKVAIECILKGSAVDAKTVPLEHETVFRYFAEVKKDALDSIKRTFTDMNLECVKSGGNYSLSIKGKATSVKGALPKVQQAVQAIKHLRCQTDKEGLAAYFTEGNGSIQITSVEKKRQCAIIAHAVSSSNPTAPARLCRNLVVEQGDIVKVKANILVNSVEGDSDNLANCGAVSAAFCKAGGREVAGAFTKNGGMVEGAVTQYDGYVGELHCEMLLHCGIRKWANAQSTQTLHGMVESCVQVADEKSLGTIAFPTLGCGQLQYPVSDVCRCFLEVARLFPNVKITVVAFDQKIFEEFQRELMRGTAKEGSISTHSLCPNFVVQEGDIVKTKADILVNSVEGDSDNLANCGAVSAAFCKAGGREVAGAFTKNGGMVEGAVTQYDGHMGELHCQMLLHCGIRKWANAQSTQTLHGMIESCVQEADEKSLGTIAFPTLGCGQLQYPVSDVCRCFLEVARLFPNVKISVVAFDQKIFEEFQRELMRGSANEGSASTHSLCPNFVVQEGDIVKTKADILVNSVAGDSDNLANCGAVSAAFCKAGGREVEGAFSQDGGMDEGDVFAYDGEMGQLQCQVLLHCSIRAWVNARNTQTLYDMIESCVQVADEKSLGTIAFPTLGCGQLQYPVSDVCRCFLEVARLFPNVKITVVAFDRTILGEFQQELIRVSVGPNGSFLHSPKTLRFFICAGDAAQCQTAKQDLVQFIASNHTTESISDEMVKFLPFLAKYRQSIEALPSKYHVRFIDAKTSTIMLTGLKHEILNATVKIKELLQQARQEKTAALVKRVLGTDAFLHFLGQEETRTPRSWPKFGGMTQVEAHKVTQNADATQFMEKSQGEEKHMLANLLAQAWQGPNNVELVEAFAIYNPLLYCQYHHRRKAYFSKCVTAPFKKIAEIVATEPDVATATFGLKRLDQERIHEINEYFFFHGTSHVTVNSIVSQNLDFRVGNSGLYGQGAYLAESASKSHQYTDEKGGISCMFVVKAPLGRVFYSEEMTTFQRPPCAQCLREKCEHNNPFDCVLGANRTQTKPRFQFREFIIYEKELTYPAFLLKYKVVP